MNFSAKTKIINLLGIVLVFFGLLALMLIHLNHHVGQEEAKEEDYIDLGQWLHIAIGFPVSVVGALLLILAERRAV